MKSEAEQRGNALAQLRERGECSVPNAAVLMGLHPHTVRSYITQGFIEAMWIGNRPWISAAEIERFNEEGKRSP